MDKSICIYMYTYAVQYVYIYNVYTCINFIAVCYYYPHAQYAYYVEFLLNSIIYIIIESPVILCLYTCTVCLHVLILCTFPYKWQSLLLCKHSSMTALQSSKCAIISSKHRSITNSHPQTITTHTHVYMFTQSYQYTLYWTDCTYNIYMHVHTCIHGDILYISYENVYTCCCQVAGLQPMPTRQLSTLQQCIARGPFPGPFKLHVHCMSP